MNPIVEFLIEENSIPQTSIILLLTLPIVATIIAIWRQIIGLRTFGIYAPVMITYAFYQFGVVGDEINFVQGLKYGFAVSIGVFITATITHEITKKVRLHYLPKMSIVLSVVSGAVLGILVLASYFEKNGFIAADTLALLLMITVAEQFISIYIKKGRRAALWLTVGTMVVSALMYVLIAWDTAHEVILKYPYLALLTLPVNFLIGRWTGFRLEEYFRFKSILVQNESE